MAVIYNGLDLEYTKKFLKNKEKIKQEIFRKYNLENDKILVLLEDLHIKRACHI